MQGNNRTFYEEPSCSHWRWRSRAIGSCSRQRGRSESQKRPPSMMKIFYGECFPAGWALQVIASVYASISTSHGARKFVLSQRNGVEKGSNRFKGTGPVKTGQYDRSKYERCIGRFAHKPSSYMRFAAVQTSSQLFPSLMRVGTPLPRLKTRGVGIFQARRIE